MNCFKIYDLKNVHFLQINTNNAQIKEVFYASVIWENQEDQRKCKINQ